jgi:hypothetical protein
VGHFGTLLASPSVLTAAQILRCTAITAADTTDRQQTAALCAPDRLFAAESYCSLCHDSGFVQLARFSTFDKH